MNGKIRVLVVEDDCSVQNVFGALLPCCEVTVVNTLQEGMNKLASDGASFDCMVLDVTLPNSQGMNTVKLFQAAAPNLPIVAMSGYSFSTEELIKSGAQEFVEKPFTRKTLSEGIRMAIARHKVRKQFEPILGNIAELRERVEQRTEKIDEALKKGKEHA